MKWFKVKEAQEILGISHTSIHNRLKKFKKPLQGHFKKENGTVYLDQHCINFLKDTVKKPENKDKPDLNLSETLLKTLQDELKQKDEVIQDLLQTQKELITNEAEARKRTDTIVMSLTSQIKEQTQLIEDLRTKQTEPDPVKPVSRKKRKLKIVKKEDPVQELPRENLIQKWYREFDEFCHPWKKRADYREKRFKKVA